MPLTSTAAEARGPLISAVLALAAGLIVSVPSHAQSGTARATGTCDANNGGITLPPGFCATIFAKEASAP